VFLISNYDILGILYDMEHMNRIKDILDEKGIKQTWLAQKLGKSYNMINSYVKNRRQPSIEDLYKIAKILDVEAKDLLLDLKGENSGK
jgi:putative transcriptional regulator